MKTSRLLFHLFFFILIAMTSSCGSGGGGGGGGSSNVNIDNSGNGDALKVLAAAGGDQVGSIQVPITLDGSGSSTDGAGELTYLWEFVTKPLGSSATLSTPTSVKTSLICDMPGTYIVKLVVTSGGVSSVPDTVTIKTFVPIANAGPNQLVSTGTTVTLDGSGSSYGGEETLYYNWTITSRPAGSNATIFDPTVVKPTFFADVNGNYEISLEVSNGIVNSTVDTVTVKSTTVPVANAGTDQTVSTGTIVALDGRASSTSDGAALTYRWSIVSKPITSAAALSDTTAALPTFKADVKGTYIISLVVNNGWENSAEDRVTIKATLPIANAGADQRVSTGAIVTLDGSGSSDSLTYKWIFKSRPGGSLATLNDSTAIKPTFIADVDGTYEIGLIVNDGIVDSAEDTITVTSTTAPVANAGPDQSISVAETVALDGSGSTDSKGAPLIYSWIIKSKPTGSSATLSNVLAVKPTFTADKAGAYVMGLVVNNGTENSVEDTVTVTATIPVANAGPDYNIAPGSTVVLDGRGSSDTNSYPLTYKWTVTSSPLGSIPTFSNPISDTPSFTADLVGAYSISLTVNNGFVDSVADVITVNVRVSVGNNSGIFSNDFEDATANGLWSVSNGIWEIGTPTSGPNVAYIGSGVAATVLAGDYPDDVSSYLESPSINLPPLDLGKEIQLSFWHWFSIAGCFFGNDSGVVQISKELSPGSWSSPVSLKFFGGFSGQWSKASIDLSGYATNKVRIRFLLSNTDDFTCVTVASGWYIDEVLVEVR